MQGFLHLAVTLHRCMPGNAGNCPDSKRSISPQVCFTLAATWLMKTLSVVAARTLHNAMLKQLLKCVAICCSLLSNKPMLFRGFSHNGLLRALACYLFGKVLGWTHPHPNSDPYLAAKRSWTAPTYS